MGGANETLATRRVLSDNAAGHRLVLRAISEGQMSTHVLPETGECIIGRSKECDVRIDDPSLSRKHARLCVGAQLSIEDLDTLNGTKVKEERVRPNKPVVISLGEAVDIGTVLIVIQRRGAAVRSDPPTAAGPTTAIENLHRLADRIAPGLINVLIQGETGSGKEVLAARLHAKSTRAQKPYVRINCAAISETLLESELFGHERGAFTGAAQAKPGLLETANGGTILLDEIGELPLALQVKLLRVIEQKEVLRVGALAPRTIDVRIVAATNRDLDSEARAGRFREDLYFRLAGITLTVPPLRERLDEIEPLAKLLVTETSERIGRRAPKISADAMAILKLYAWPGNVRELRNVMERAALLADSGPIDPEHLPLEKMSAAQSSVSALQSDEPSTLAPQDARAKILDALARSGGNQTKAAKLLGISRRTLTNRLNELQLPRPRKP